MGLDFDDLWFGDEIGDAFGDVDWSGNSGAREAARKNQANVNAALGDIDAGSWAALDDYDLSIDQFRSAMEFFQQGFPGVMDELNAVGDASQAAALDQHEAAIGGIDDSLISSGRFGTSARESLQGGERSRYMRDVANINEGLGALRSNVRMQGLQSTVGLMQGLGGAFERRGNVSERQGFKLADTRMQTQYEAPGGVLDQLGGADGIASIAGLFM